MEVNEIFFLGHLIMGDPQSYYTGSNHAIAYRYIKNSRKQEQQEAKFDSQKEVTTRKKNSSWKTKRTGSSGENHSAIMFAVYVGCKRSLVER